MCQLSRNLQSQYSLVYSWSTLLHETECFHSKDFKKHCLSFSIITGQSHVNIITARYSGLNQDGHKSLMFVKQINNTQCPSDHRECLSIHRHIFVIWLPEDYCCLWWTPSSVHVTRIYPSISSLSIFYKSCDYRSLEYLQEWWWLFVLAARQT